jgi:hypothetical protein
MKKTIKLLILCTTILLVSCRTTSQLSAPINSFVQPSSSITFLAYRAASAPGLTLVDILKAEKLEFGEDIRLINVIEQTQTINVFFVFSKQTKYYIYDVVRLKK